jgi:hypothetical protein
MLEELKIKFRRDLEEGWNKGNTDAWEKLYAVKKCIDLDRSPRADSHVRVHTSRRLISAPYSIT